MFALLLSLFSFDQAHARPLPDLFAHMIQSIGEEFDESFPDDFNSTPSKMMNKNSAMTYNTKKIPSIDRENMRTELNTEDTIELGITTYPIVEHKAYDSYTYAIYQREKDGSINNAHAPHVRITTYGHKELPVHVVVSEYDEIVDVRIYRRDKEDNKVYKTSFRIANGKIANNKCEKTGIIETNLEKIKAANAPQVKYILDLVDSKCSQPARKKCHRRENKGSTRLDSLSRKEKIQLVEELVRSLNK